MKIVQVQTQAEAAGAQRVSDMVGEGLRGRGHAVRTVFMYRKTDAYDADPHADFALRERPRGMGGQLRAVFALIGYMRREKPDAVISYQHFGNVFGTLAGRLAGARFLIANQSGAPFTKGLPAFASFIDKLMGTLGIYQYSITNSAWTERQFAQYPSAYRRRLRRIDHGVYPPPQPYDRMKSRQHFGLPMEAPLVVSSGRLVPSKKFAVLVRALALLPDTHLAIAGAGPEHDTLLALARELGVLDRLHPVGEVQPATIHQFLAAGNVYAFGSVLETFGLAVVEAAVSGLPVVCSDLPVLQEVLTTDRGVNAAVFVPPDDPEAYAKAIGAVLGDETLRQHLSAAGRALANQYAPARMCERYEQLLR